MSWLPWIFLMFVSKFFIESLLMEPCFSQVREICLLATHRACQNQHEIRESSYSRQSWESQQWYGSHNASHDTIFPTSLHSIPLTWNVEAAVSLKAHHLILSCIDHAAEVSCTANNYVLCASVDGFLFSQVWSCGMMDILSWIHNCIEPGMNGARNQSGCSYDWRSYFKPGLGWVVNYIARPAFEFMVVIRKNIIRSMQNPC